jgi:hypothetical protein
MSNHDDFWTTLATGHSNTLLAGAMDTHLSGKSIDETFGSVRTLTDRHREANALALPVEAGTKVVFAGGLGAVMSYDDAPADGITGEVVTVKSATGEITHHGGKVFVKWADGKFRPVHAEHLRLAHEGKKGKKAYQVSPGIRALESKYGYAEGPHADSYLKPGGSSLVKEYGTGRMDIGIYTDSNNALAGPPVKWATAWSVELPEVTSEKEAKSIGKKIRRNLRRQQDLAGSHYYDLSKVPMWVVYAGGKTKVASKQASDIKQQFEKIKALAEKRPDSDFLKSILKQMADKGFAPTDKQMAVVKKIEGEIKQQGEMKKELKGLDKKGEFNADDIGKKQNGPLIYDPEDKKIMNHFGQGDLHEMSDVANDKTATFRVASLGDLTDFLKVASGALVHKSTKDLWSYSKDADGNFLVSRLFNDEGKPLKV